nr:protein TRIGALACTOSYLDIACYLGLYCEROL 4, chloroplastic [Ipomoea batatas]
MEPTNFCRFTTLLGQLNVQKLISSIRNKGSVHPSESSWLQTVRRHLSDKSLYALNLCSELLLTPEDILLVSLEAHGDVKTARKKAVFHHKFPQHDLTVEAALPGLYTDQLGNYWDVPFALAFDLASVASESGISYHLLANHNTGSPKQCQGQQPAKEIPPSLLPGLCAKGAVSLKKSVDLWRSEAPLLKMVQPYDIFLSSPHISASGILGSVVSAYLGENSIRSQSEDASPAFKNFSLRAQGANAALSADLFASFSLTAQHGNFQRLFLDLTRLHARLDIPSGSNFISGAVSVARDLYKSQMPITEAIQAVCPNVMLSFQQQIAGPFSLRVDSEIAIDFKDFRPRVKNPIFALEHSLQVLGSAKAVAWYSPNQQEFMVELRFFES